MPKILLVEDDTFFGTGVQTALKQAGHIVEWIQDGNEALDRLLLYSYDLALIDWKLPGLEGPEICRRYRNQGGQIPILMLTGLNQPVQKVDGLDAGADDYITKPVSVIEVLARVRALMRRPTLTRSNTVTSGQLCLDRKSRTVKKGEKDILLQRMEFALLEFFMTHPDEVFTVEALLQRVWNTESESTEAAVRMCVTRLRSKLDDAEDYIQTVKGCGYRFAPPA